MGGGSGLTSERVEEYLLLVGVLRDEREVGAAIDHPHLHLEDETTCFSRRRVVLCNRLVERGGHECGLDTATHSKLIALPELLRECAAADASIDDGRLGELAELDHHGIDQEELRKGIRSNSEVVEWGWPQQRGAIGLGVRGFGARGFGAEAR